MNEIIVIPEERIREIFREELAAQLRREQKEQNDDSPGRLSPDAAVKYLRSLGCRITKSGLYRLTSNREIPFGRLNKRLYFSPKELREWFACRTAPEPDPAGNQASMIAQSARRKK